MQIYKLIFRFSIERLIDYLAKDVFLVTLLSYVQSTQLERFHQRSVLNKQITAYYRATENLLNLTSKRGKV